MSGVLVTGASGYVGANLCRNLAASGRKVIGHAYPQPTDNDRWRDSLSERDLDTIGALLAPLLSDLGYAPDQTWYPATKTSGVARV